MVKAFNGVMMKDLQYAIDDPEEAAEILHKGVPAQDVDSAKGEVEKMGPVCHGRLGR